METWAIVVAAGSGARFGGTKQFAQLRDRTVVDWSVVTAQQTCDGVVVVVPADAEWRAPTDVQTTRGGDTRSDSVRAGLACIPAAVDVIVVHDAARPLASRRLFTSVIDAIAGGADAAVPALPIADTVKRVRGNDVIETVPRTGLVAVQTPQAFRAGMLRAAHADGAVDTDDAALVEAAGGKVVIVDGDPRNFKLTRPDDLDLARDVIGSRS